MKLAYFGVGDTLVIHYILSSRMPTTKKRLNITLPEDLEEMLMKLSKRDKVPVATKAVQLIHLAMEIEEDDYFTEVAERRLKNKKAKYVSHQQVWS